MAVDMEPWDPMQETRRWFNDGAPGDDTERDGAASPEAPRSPAHMLDDATRTAPGEVCAACRAAGCPAVEAAFAGHDECLRQLQLQGRVYGARDDMGATPLHAAAEGGRLSCVVFLVERAGADLIARDKIGNTPAHHAVFHNHIKIVAYLRQQGANLQESTEEGSTLVHYAAARGHFDALKWLCSDAVGCEPNEPDANGAAPLYFAAQEGHQAIVEWLVSECDADVIHPSVDGMCPLHAAAQAGRSSCLAFMLRYIRKPIQTIRDNDGATCMHFAAAKGHVDCLRLLLRMPACSGEEVDRYGATPTHDAAENGSLNCLKVLSTHGVDLNVKDKSGNTPLDLASAAGHTDCMFFLQSKIPSVDGELRERRPSSPTATSPVRKPTFASLFEDQNQAPPLLFSSAEAANWNRPSLRRHGSLRTRAHSPEPTPEKKEAKKSFWGLFGRKKAEKSR